MIQLTIRCLLQATIVLLSISCDANEHRFIEIDEDEISSAVSGYKVFGNETFGFVVYQGQYDHLKAGQTDLAFLKKDIELKNNESFEAFNIYRNKNSWSIVRLENAPNYIATHIAQCRKSYSNQFTTCDFRMNGNGKYVEFTINQENLRYWEEVGTYLLNMN